MAEIRSASSKPKQRKVQKKEESRKESQLESGSGELVKKSVQAEEATQQRSMIGQMNPRDSLLASIRDAAGKPKRQAGQSVKSSRLSNRIEQKEQSEVAPAGDLMSDLVNKLRARRDGISGSFVAQKAVNNTENGNSTSMTVSNLKPSTTAKESALPADTIQQRVMNQVSSMIPERPAQSSESEREEFDDGDWD